MGAARGEAEEGDYARGVIINREGPITREEAQAILDRRYGRKVVDLMPVLAEERQS